MTLDNNLTLLNVIRYLLMEVSPQSEWEGGLRKTLMESVTKWRDAAEQDVRKLRKEE